MPVNSVFPQKPTTFRSGVTIRITIVINNCGEGVEIICKYLFLYNRDFEVRV